EKHGAVPLPPYIKRAADNEDASQYQTVYAREPGSVAAPTAGLHFTDRLLGELAERGIQWKTLTLHVGYGTFGPLDPQAKELHEESYEVDDKLLHDLRASRDGNHRVIAVGTT